MKHCWMNKVSLKLSAAAQEMGFFGAEREQRQAEAAMDPATTLSSKGKYLRISC